MIQELLEIVNMLLVDVMSGIVDLVEIAPLGDEVSNLFALIRFLKVVHRVVVTGKRVASRIQAKKRTEQGRDAD